MRRLAVVACLAGAVGIAGCTRSTDSTPAAPAPAAGSAVASAPAPSSASTASAPAPVSSTVPPSPSTTGAPSPTPTTGTPAANTPTASDPTEPAATVETTAVESTAVETTDTVSTCLEQLSLRQRIALLVWPAVYSGAWDAAIATVRDHGVGGVVLMEPSDWTPDEVAVRLDELEAVAATDLVIATDEEGGEVQRLRLLGELPSQQEASEAGTPEAAGAAIADHAAVLRSVGIDVVFGPVVDVVPPSGEVSLDRSRFFTGDASVVTRYAQAYVDGWSAGGIVPVLKHFPGHGTASADTHLDAGVTDPLAALELSDLVPYRELAATGAAVMVGHLTVPGLTGDLPATRSPEAIRYLRETLGYGDALVVSDALGMGAVGIGVDAAAVEAIAAGIDVAIFTDTALAAAVIDALEQAVSDGRVPPERIAESARRVLRLTPTCHLGSDPK